MEEQRRFSLAALLSGPLDTLREQAAVLDRTGTVVAVSTAWERAANGGATLGLPRSPIGTDYPAACLAAADTDQATAAAAALRAVLTGVQPQARVTYACGPAAPSYARRWYEMRVIALVDTTGITGVAVFHQDITEHQLAQLWQDWVGRVVEDVGSGLCLTDLAGTVIFLEAGWAGMHGYTVDEVVGHHASLFYPPERYDMEVRPFVRAVRAHGRCQAELQHRRRDGTVFLAETTAVLVRDDEGTPVGIVTIARDITDRRNAEEALLQSEERFRALVQNGSDIIVVVSPDGTTRYVSPSLERVLGYRAEELTSRRYSVDEWVHPDDVAQVDRIIQQALARPGEYPSVEFRVRHRDGSWRHIEAVVTSLVDVPAVNGIVINARDISERKHLEMQLRYQAFHDALTGLPNRALFLDRLEHALARLARGGPAIAVLFIDLDGFKLVNDSLGHSAGDALLDTVGRRLTGCLRSADTVARFGGDEFAVLIEDAGTPSRALKIATRLIEAISVPTTLDGREVAISASIGITLTGSGTSSPENLLREADTALYQAKAGGKGRATLFDDGMNARVRERLKLETDLRRALERGELALHYQPVVDLATGVVVGVEALLRWYHPERGLVPPDAFIPLAEETGLIVPIGRWVLEEACSQAAAWQAMRGPDAPLALAMSVNISARQFAQRDLAEQVGEALGRSGLAPQHLRLEITESAMMADIDLAVANLMACQELGVGLALDDFGTGYSSLSHLLRFPVDEVKIDRSFVQRLGEDESAVAVIRAITATAQALKLSVTGEGIETPIHVCRLRDLHCQRGQGYYFARPLPADAIAPLLSQSLPLVTATGGPCTPDRCAPPVRSKPHRQRKEDNRQR